LFCSGSGDGETEEEQQPGGGQGNTETDEENLEDNGYQDQNPESDETENNYPMGGGGAAEPDSGEVTEESPESVEPNQSDSVIEGGQETGEEEQQTEPQQNKKPGVAGKKLYRYNYGNILNGIDIKPGSTEENYSELDKRINRIMTSKIVEEEDMTEEEILEIEEEIKNESGVVSSSSDRDTLPDTGDTNQYNFLYSFVLLLAGGILFFLTKRPGNE